MLQMILKSCRNCFLILIFLSSPHLQGEDKIDIWKDNSNKKIDTPDGTGSISEEKKNSIDLNLPQKIETNQKINVQENFSKTSIDSKIFGIHDPADFNFNLNMWSNTKAEDVRSILKRLKKIKLSNTSNEILEGVLFSFSYPPNGMEEKEFVNLKINWLIDNNRVELIEDFLKQNKEFEGKSRAVQFLVDDNIAQANIKKGCDKIEFIDSTIKDAYLEKFKIYCLIFNKKKPQAQLLLDLLREQKQSDKFFDDKINFLLGISSQTSEKINEKNLLNFYLSSITINNFNYEPTTKTKKEIWKYLNAANLIKLDDITDNEKLKKLELAANEGQIDIQIIFNIYKQMPFNLNTLINAKNVYQTLDEIEARSLIYQKFLLSEDLNVKLEYLFLLEELFNQKDIEKIYSKFVNNVLKEIGLENIPEKFKETAESRVAKRKEDKIGKVKYNDKVLHQSNILKYYLESESEKKIQKEINKVIKKISKNRKYFYSAKDLALINSLMKDGFEIPSNLDFKELTSKYEIPKNLFQLIENEQSAFLALKIVEILGEDEPYQLDPESIYFITSLLNDTDLIKFRNKVLISALPQRI